MPIIEGKKLEKEGVFDAAKLMLIAARTSPKTGGIDDIVTVLVMGEEKDALANEMEKIADERGIVGFKRDAKSVRDSDAVILIGVRGTKAFGLNCGACGYVTCEEFTKVEKKIGQDFIGPVCHFKILDLGIALGSAVKMASELNVDNRIMYRVGAAAKRLNMLPEADVIEGIPMSATGKNIYFNRKSI